jgi:hypothetical protein
LQSGIGALSSAGGALSSAAGALSSAGGALSSAGGALSSAAGALASAASAPRAQPAAEAPAPTVTSRTVEQAAGGLITGSGDSTSDTIPAWLSPHEYVIKASTVQRVGVPFLDRINAGNFAAGGWVGRYASGGLVQEAIRAGISSDDAIKMSDGELQAAIREKMGQPGFDVGAWLAKLARDEVERGKPFVLSAIESFERIPEASAAAKAAVRRFAAHLRRPPAEEPVASPTGLAALIEKARKEAEERRKAEEPKRPEAVPAPRPRPPHTETPPTTDTITIERHGAAQPPEMVKFPKNKEELRQALLAQIGATEKPGPVRSGATITPGPVSMVGDREVMERPDPASGQFGVTQVSGGEYDETLHKFVSVMRGPTPYEKGVIEKGGTVSPGHITVTDFDRAAYKGKMTPEAEAYLKTEEEAYKDALLSEQLRGLTPKPRIVYPPRPVRAEGLDTPVVGRAEIERAAAQQERQERRRREPLISYGRSRRRRGEDYDQSQGLYAFGGLVQRDEGVPPGGIPRDEGVPPGGYPRDMGDEGVPPQGLDEGLGASILKALTARDPKRDNRPGDESQPQGLYAFGGLVPGFADGGDTDQINASDILRLHRYFAQTATHLFPYRYTGTGVRRRITSYEGVSPYIPQMPIPPRGPQDVLADSGDRVTNRTTNTTTNVRNFIDGVEYALGGLVPARVSNGEYLMSGGAVARTGVGFMDALNQGSIKPRGLAFGGVAGPMVGQTYPYAGDVPGGVLGRMAAADALATAQVYGAAVSAKQYNFGDMGLASVAPALGRLPVQDAEGPSMHTLDLATPGGNFQVAAAADTIEAIRASAIGSRLTSTGTRPSWY